MDGVVGDGRVALGALHLDRDRHVACTLRQQQPAAQGHALALERGVGDVEGDLLAAVAFERDAPFVAVAESDLDAVAAVGPAQGAGPRAVGCTREPRSEEHTSELQSLMRISYAVFCLKKKKK